MRMMKFAMIAVLVVAGVGTATTRFLPESSYYQGRSFYDTGSLKGYLDFAVYQTQEFTGYGFNAPDAEKAYVYAYQVVSDAMSTEAIEYFNLLGIGLHTDIDSITMGTEEDWFGGGLDADDMSWVGSDDNPFDTALWQFEPDMLVAGEKSFYLLLSSDHDYVIGDYSFDRPDGGSVVIPNPEPGTLALVGIGGLLLSRSRRRKAV